MDVVLMDLELSLAPQTSDKAWFKNGLWLKSFKFGVNCETKRPLLMFWGIKTLAHDLVLYMPKTKSADYFCLAAVPSGKLLHNYGKSPFSMGKSHYFYGHFQ